VDIIAASVVAVVVADVAVVVAVDIAAVDVDVIVVAVDIVAAAVVVEVAGVAAAVVIGVCVVPVVANRALRHVSHSVVCKATRNLFADLSKMAAPREEVSFEVSSKQSEKLGRSASRLCVGVVRKTLCWTKFNHRMRLSTPPQKKQVLII
jgi:hypothetical protein